MVQSINLPIIFQTYPYLNRKVLGYRLKLLIVEKRGLDSYTAFRSIGVKSN